MDPSVFDRVSRVLATRRTVLGSPFAGSLLAVLGLAGMTSEAAAAPCPKGKKRCKKRCIPRQQCCTNANCKPAATGKVCQRGRCVCGPGTKPCQGRCIGQAACCGGCPQGQRCSGGACVPSCGTPGVPCRVFITSQTYDGNLGGLAGADARCQALANASPRTQGGTYKAWLSDFEFADSPALRFANTAQTGPYLRVDDAATVIASGWADLTDTELQATISTDELGQPIGDPALVWSNTGTGGFPRSASNCEGWSILANDEFGGIGTATFTDFHWTDNGAVSCDTPSRLYCFEQG